MIYVLVSLAKLILMVLQIAFFARAILSWFPIDSEGTLATLLDAITEPIIQPVRKLMEKAKFLDSMPFDLSFLVTFVLISILFQML